MSIGVLKKIILESGCDLEKQDECTIVVADHKIKTVDFGFNESSNDEMSNHLFYQQNASFFDGIFSELLNRYSKFDLTLQFRNGKVIFDEHSYLTGSFEFRNSNDLINRIRDIQRKFPEIFIQPRSEVVIKGYKKSLRRLNYKLYIKDDFNQYKMTKEIARHNLMFCLRLEELVLEKSFVHAKLNKDHEGRFTDIYERIITLVSEMD